MNPQTGVDTLWEDPYYWSEGRWRPKMPHDLESLGLAEAEQDRLARANEVVKVDAQPFTTPCSKTFNLAGKTVAGKTYHVLHCPMHATVLYVRPGAGKVDQVVDARCGEHLL